MLTAIALIDLSVVGVLMWLRRRPAGGFGAPPVTKVKFGWAAFAVIALGILLPLFGASVLVILIVVASSAMAIQPRRPPRRRAPTRR